MIPLNINPNGLNVIINKVFIANSIIPLAIQKDEFDQSKKIYKVLFKLTQNIDNTNIFFEIRLRCDDELDKNYLQSKSIYINNLKKDENKYKAFKDIMKDFDSGIFYVGSFSTAREDGNYYIYGIKELKDKNGNSFYENMKIYIPRYMYIIINLYLENLLDAYSGIEKEILFVDNKIKEMRFEKVEDVKLIGTAKRESENGMFSYNSIYEMNCGPTSWKFTYEVLSQEDLDVKVPIDPNTFDAEYSQYNDLYIGAVPDMGFTYVTVLVKDKIKTLMVPEPLMIKTNLIDPYNIFIEDIIDDEIDEDEDDNIVENINSDWSEETIDGEE